MRFLILLMCATPALWAQEETKAWSNKIDLAGVFTSGNSESSHLSLADHYAWKRDKSQFKLSFAAVRAEDTRITRTAVGTADNYVLVEDKENKLSAENYHLDMVYSRKFSARTGWFTGLNWKRDEIAGVESRLGLSAGLTNTWLDSDTHKLSTSYGAKWVTESNVYEDENFDDSYPAVTLALDHFVKVTKTSEYSQKLNIDFNTDETDAYQADWSHDFSVSVSDRIALKLGLQLKYDNEPAVEGVPLEGTGVVISVPYDKLDTVFTSAVVIKM